MENGSIKIPKTSLAIITYRLIQINRMLPFLGIRAKLYDTGELNKIIINSLSPNAMQKDVGDGGDNLDDITDILNLCTSSSAGRPGKLKKIPFFEYFVSTYFLKQTSLREKLF